MNRNRVLQEASEIIYEHLSKRIGANTFFLAKNDLVHNHILSAWNREESLIEGGTMLPYAHAYCQEVRHIREPIRIEDTAADPRTRHMQVTQELGPCSFIGVPVVRRGGEGYGTLCALDRNFRFTEEAFRDMEQAAVFLGVLLDVEQSLYIDELTQVFNRDYLEMFYDHLSSDLEMSTIFIDIDHCKQINEAYGRETGDHLLRQTADRLKRALAGVGIPARYAGDEFMGLLFHRTSDEVRAVAQSIYESVTKPYEILGRELSITVSMGVCLQGASLQDHIIKSDTAMFQIKKNGKRGIAVYEETLEPLIPENGFRRSVKYNSFQVLYQPIRQIETGETAVEALIRLNHPEMGLVSPGQFLPYARASGYLEQMDLQTIRSACAEIQTLDRWRERIAKLAVNCDVMELANPEFPERVARIMEETGFPANRLEFELNERISIFDTESILPQIVRMIEFGITFALDDFGQGYSTLGLLKSLPVQKVKLDRMFVENVDEDAANQAIVSGLVEIARRLKLPMVAEGIETDREIETLRQYGCVWMQGYRLGKPVPIEQLEGMLDAAYDYIQ
ncbi:bifunctional diguanylate cyclase/phosphodiesterase [Paenibacillus sp. TRM 82003]|nr:bifunctional diguanylate cyclase/phosphodiesterase [Paenibacillus sp. TRM 82003]